MEKGVSIKIFFFDSLATLFSKLSLMKLSGIEPQVNAIVERSYVTFRLNQYQKSL